MRCHRALGRARPGAKGAERDSIAKHRGQFAASKPHREHASGQLTGSRFKDTSGGHRCRTPHRLLPPEKSAYWCGHREKPGSSQGLERRARWETRAGWLERLAREATVRSELRTPASRRNESRSRGLCAITNSYPFRCRPRDMQKPPPPTALQIQDQNASCKLVNRSSVLTRGQPSTRRPAANAAAAASERSLKTWLSPTSGGGSPTRGLSSSCHQPTSCQAPSL